MKMKHFILTSLSACLVLSTACTNEEVVNGIEQSQEQTGISMIASDFIIDHASRSTFEEVGNEAVFTWSADDVVGVFPNEGNQVAFPMQKGAGTNHATFDGGGWLLKPSATYMSYYPLIKEFELDKTAVPVSYEGQVFNYTADGKIQTGKYDYMTSYGEIPSNGSLLFKFKHVGCMVIMDMTLPNAGTLNNVKLSLPKGENLLVKSGTLDLTTQPVDQSNPTPLEIQNPVMTNEYAIKVSGITTQKNGEKVRVCFMMAPVDLTGKTLNVVLTVNGKDELARTVKISKPFKPGVAYTLADPVPVDGKTIEVKTPGTLKQLLGSNTSIKELAVKGKLNGDDIRFIRSMAGADQTFSAENSLKDLDLSQATIVAGGGSYIDTPDLPVGRAASQTEIKTQDFAVGPSMFSNCTTLTRLILPANTTSIGNYAFLECSNLTELSIPGSVTSMGEDLFLFSGLQKITFEEGTSPLTFSPNAFKQTDIKSFTIPARVSEIPAFCFSCCSELTSITIPATVTKVDEGAFNCCSKLLSVQIDADLLTLSPAIFQECTLLTTVKFPANVQRIGAKAFERCPLSSSIVLPTSVKTIEENAFAYSTISDIVFNEGLERIEQNAFYQCKNIKKVELPVSLKEMSDCAFNWGKSETNSCPTEITFKSATPPTLLVNMVEDQETLETMVKKAPDNYNARLCKVHVRYSSVNAYLTSPWFDKTAYNELYSSTDLQCFDAANIMYTTDNGKPLGDQIDHLTDGGNAY